MADAAKNIASKPIKFANFLLILAFFQWVRFSVN